VKHLLSGTERDDGTSLEIIRNNAAPVIARLRGAEITMRSSRDTVGRAALICRADLLDVDIVRTLRYGAGSGLPLGGCLVWGCRRSDRFA
jgi:hypothetical protein